MFESLVLLDFDGVEPLPRDFKLLISEALMDESEPLEVEDSLEDFGGDGDVARAARGSKGLDDVDDDDGGFTVNEDAGTLDGNFFFKSFFDDLTKDGEKGYREMKMGVFTRNNHLNNLQ